MCLPANPESRPDGIKETWVAVLTLSPFVNTFVVIMIHKLADTDY